MMSFDAQEVVGAFDKPGSPSGDSIQLFPRLFLSFLISR